MTARKKRSPTRLRRAQARRFKKSSEASRPTQLTWEAIQEKLSEFSARPSRKAKQLSSAPPLDLQALVPKPPGQLPQLLDALSGDDEFKLRVLLGHTLLSPWAHREISLLPEPYRLAALLLPGQGWRFIRMAGLHSLANDEYE